MEAVKVSLVGINLIIPCYTSLPPSFSFSLADCVFGVVILDMHASSSSCTPLLVYHVYRFEEKLLMMKIIILLNDLLTCLSRTACGETKIHLFAWRNKDEEDEKDYDLITFNFF